IRVSPIRRQDHEPHATQPNRTTPLAAGRTRVGDPRTIADPLGRGHSPGMRVLKGLVRLIARSAVMLLVMAVVIPVAVVTGLPAPVTLALAIGLPGLTGLFWVGRRRGAMASARRAAGAASAAIRGVGPGTPSRRGAVPDVETAFEDP